MTDGLLDEFGEGLVIDTPISERRFSARVGAACGDADPSEFQFFDFISCGFDAD